MAEYQTGETTSNESFVERPKWTIMIYLAGDNSLSANSIAIMQALEDASHRKDVRVLACFDSNTPLPKGARYLEINHRRFLCSHPPMQWGLHNDLVPPEERERHSVVAPDFCAHPSTPKFPTEPVAKEGLSRFLKFALKKHLAHKHMLIVFGHGTVVAGDIFLTDNNPPSFIRLKDFAEVLGRHFGDGQTKDKNGRIKPRLDILACDNCVMSGIEVGYEVRNLVDYMIGSEGLMLTVAWPYRKIINAVERAVAHNPNVSAETVAHKVLRACARSLLDFSLMERSSEQSLCDLTKLRNNEPLVAAIRKLSSVLQRGLAYDKNGKVLFPPIRDAVKLARLEAQSYWDETFVDLYDFCLLLLMQCNQAIKDLFDLAPNLHIDILQLSESHAQPTGSDSSEALAGSTSSAAEVSKLELIDILKSPPVMKLFGEIAGSCKEVLEEIKLNDPRNPKFVVSSYYVGPDLQYSNGVSVYFPWTLPDEPIFFDPVRPRYSGSEGKGSEAAPSGYGCRQEEPTDFTLKSPFEEYKLYKFAMSGGGDWAAFLESFFRATLRDVRRFEYEYDDARSMEPEYSFIRTVAGEPTPDMEAHKSGSDVGIDNECARIKNYPRRFYVSPADCLRRCDLPPYGVGGMKNGEPCVQYLGWNIRGLLAKIIKLKMGRNGHKSGDSQSSESQ